MYKFCNYKFENINFLMSWGTLYTGQKSFPGPGKIGRAACTPVAAIWQISYLRALHIIHYSMVRPID